MFKPLGLIQACDAGYHFSEAFGGCVLDDPDIIVPVPGGNAPMSNTVKYAMMGIGLLLLLGAFAGGRASKRTTSRPYSRTTTRTLFA